jgi:hypothetical protein
VPLPTALCLLPSVFPAFVNLTRDGQAAAKLGNAEIGICKFRGTSNLLARAPCGHQIRAGAARPLHYVPASVDPPGPKWFPGFPRPGAKLTQIEGRRFYVPREDGHFCLSGR